MSPIPPNEYRPSLRPPQFRLSTLLLLITCLAGAFASLTLLGRYGTPPAMLLILCVVVHVVGTRIGYRLRANGDRPVDEEGRPLPRSKRPPLTGRDFAPTTRLSERYSLGWPLLVVTVLGVLLGGGLGGAGLVWLNWERINLFSIAFALVACGVLGGIAGFWIGSFVQVITTAGAQAGRHR
ncbi:MAG: hypothetical protein RIC55_07350 [Pirellulaceae bacterium]